MLSCTAQGRDGLPGLRGAAGDRGDIGPPGNPGAHGRDGEDGPKVSHLIIVTVLMIPSVARDPQAYQEIQVHKASQERELSYMFTY